MQIQLSLKKFFLSLIIFALSASAIVGIAIVLFGTFNETQGKVLLTTLTLGIISVAGLANSPLLRKQSYKYLAYTGYVLLTIAFISTVFTIWFTPYLPDNFFKLQLSIYILTFSVIQTSLIELISSKTMVTEISKDITIILIALLAALLVYLVFNMDKNLLELARIAGTIAILDVLGSIITPILNRFTPTND